MPSKYKVSASLRMTDGHVVWYNVKINGEKARLLTNGPTGYCCRSVFVLRNMILKMDDPLSVGGCNTDTQTETEIKHYKQIPRRLKCFFPKKISSGYIKIDFISQSVKRKINDFGEPLKFPNRFIITQRIYGKTACELIDDGEYDEDVIPNSRNLWLAYVKNMKKNLTKEEERWVKNLDDIHEDNVMFERKTKRFYCVDLGV